MRCAPFAEDWKLGDDFIDASKNRGHLCLIKLNGEF